MMLLLLAVLLVGAASNCAAAGLCFKGLAGHWPPGLRAWEQDVLHAARRGALENACIAQYTLIPNAQLAMQPKI